MIETDYAAEKQVSQSVLEALREPRRRQRHSCRRLEQGPLLDAATSCLRRNFGAVEPASAYLSDDFLLIRTGNLLGDAERNLLRTGDEGDADFVRAMKLRLAEIIMPELVACLTDVAGLHFLRRFLSYSPQDDELVILLNLR